MRRGAVDLVDDPVAQGDHRGALAGSVGSGSKAGPDVGHLVALGGDLIGDPRGEVELRARIDAGVEQRRDPRLLGVGALGLEVGGEDRA